MCLENLLAQQHIPRQHESAVPIVVDHMEPDAVGAIEKCFVFFRRQPKRSSQLLYPISFL
jgi:hypothetical protein